MARSPDAMIGTTHDFEDWEAENEESGPMDVKHHSVASEEDAWGGIDDVPFSHAPNASTSVQPTRAPPTRDEIRTIREATDLFRSSTFKLQVDALLPTVRPKQSHKPPLERFLMQLHEVMMAIPAVEPLHPLRGAELLSSNPSSSASKSKKKTSSHIPVATPFCQPYPGEATNWKVGFSPPTEITLVGSWATETSVRGQDNALYGVDLAIEMPSSLFQEKDHLNGRFFQKRAFYLACTASALANSPTIRDHVTVSYTIPSHDSRLVQLVLQSNSVSDSEVDFTKLLAEIRITPVLGATSPIPIGRLSPSYSNLRVASGPDTPTQQLSSAIYNNAILLSMAPTRRLLSVYETKSNSPAFADALTLLRVWANQRGYGCSTRSSMCLAGFESMGAWWAAILELVIRGEDASARVGNTGKVRKPLGQGLSSYQLFKSAINFLATHDFGNHPVATKSTNGLHFSVEEYTSNHSASFIDAETSVNMLAGVPLTTLDMLRLDAQTSLDVLNSSSDADDVFKHMFLTDHRGFATRFDVVLRINTSDISASMPLGEVLNAGSTRRALTAFVCKTLKRGLSDRVKAVAVMVPPPEVLPINDQLVDTRLPWMHVGLVLDLECAYRLVDHGPAAAQNAEQEVEAFKNFWGSKSELRRFKDGRITESVVWEAPSTDDRLQIPTMIVRHLLQTHLGISSASVTSWQPSFDSLIRLPSPVAAFYTRNGIQGGFRPALLAFQEMVRSIKSLDDKFPLGILNISPASSILRSTSVFAPVPISVAASKSTPVHAKHLPVMDITIQFEKAGQWPDDLQAIQKVKLAFLEQLATALESKEPGMKAEIVLDRSALATADHAALQIITPAGWAFSAHIHHDREALLLDRIIDDRSHITRRKLSQPTDPVQVRARRHALRALDIHHRRFAHAPAHHRAVSHLTSQYPAYPGTVRLVKRWFASHWLLRGHVSEEAVELVTCMVFLNTGSTRNAPNTRERGFAAVMSLLREWKWEEGMTIPIYELDEQQSSPSSSVQPLTRSLASATAAWRLVTTINPDGRMWTAQGPDAVVARRIQTLARATCEVLSEMHHGCVDVKSVFSHPTADYDVILHLEPAVLTRYGQNVTQGTSNPEGTLSLMIRKDLAGIPHIDFDPAELLYNDLQAAYGDTFKLFYDCHGGQRMGLVWDPTLREPRPFRVMNGFSCEPTAQGQKGKQSSLVALNEAGILTEIGRMGEGLITSMVQQT